MNVKEWHNQGYLVVIREGMVYLIHTNTIDKIHARPVDEGRWQDYNDLKDWWIPGYAGSRMLPDFMLILQLCYCDQLDGTLCDMCSGLRTVEGHKEIAIKRINQVMTEAKCVCGQLKKTLRDGVYDDPFCYDCYQSLRVFNRPLLDLLYDFKRDDRWRRFLQCFHYLRRVGAVPAERTKV